MTDEIRWFTCPDRYLRARLHMPEPVDLVFVAAVDVLAALDRPDELRSTLELMLARHSEHNVAGGSGGVLFPPEA